MVDVVIKPPKEQKWTPRVGMGVKMKFGQYKGKMGVIKSVAGNSPKDYKLTVTVYPMNVVASVHYNHAEPK